MAVKVETLKQVSMQQPGKPGSYYVGTFLRYLLLSLIGLVLFMPFILAALGTFKTDAEIISFPPRLFPQQWLVENWPRVWNTDLGNGGTFPRWLFNTAFLSVTVAVLEVIFCSMAAYAFARMEFPGRDAVFNFMLATMMIPGAVLNAVAASDSSSFEIFFSVTFTRPKSSTFTT